MLSRVRKYGHTASVRGMGANILTNRQTVSPRLPSEPSLPDSKKRAGCDQRGQAGATDQRRRTGSCKTSPQFYWWPSYRSNLLSISRRSELRIPAPYGRPPRRIAPMRIYHRRGRLIGESQERVARASLLPGDLGVSPTTKTPLVLASRRGARSKTTQGEGMRSTSSWSWKSPLDRRLTSRMATRPFQFTGMEEKHTPKSELLHHIWLAMFDVDWYEK